MDIQAKVSRTGTVTGTEFSKRGASEAPAPLALEASPSDSLVAPGDFASATRLTGDRR